jgi:hypothetical protein
VNGEELGRRTAETFRRAVAAAIDPIRKELAELREKAATFLTADSLPDPEMLIAKAAQRARENLPEPRDGKDADPAVIGKMVDDAVALAVEAIPAPAVQSEDDLARLVSAAVDTAIAKIPAARDGKDVDPALVAEIITRRLDAAIADLPRPADGRSVTIDDVAPMIASEVAKAAGQIRVPQDGKDADPALVRSLVEEAVERAVAEIPLPKDGASVTADDVAPIVDAQVRRAIAALPKPAEARGIASATLTSDGTLLLRMTDGEDLDVGRVVGKDADTMAILRQVTESVPKPRDGRDGVATRDELQLLIRDGIAAALDGAVEAAVAKAFEKHPKIEYRNVWEPGIYSKGNVVTFGGCGWICLVDSTEQKPGTTKDWQLFVKKGRDGRDRDR